jgi:dTMP kinase
MAASRAQLLREIIKPALTSGKIVIADRFIDSSLAYQGYGRQIGEEEIWRLNQLGLEGVIPSLTILLDISVADGIRRRNGTGKIDRLDLQQKDFYERVCQGYKKLADKYKDRFVIIDGNNEIEKTALVIWEKVNNLINKSQ